jgi:hypothetical protein
MRLDQNVSCKIGNAETPPFEWRRPLVRRHR